MSILHILLRRLRSLFSYTTEDILFAVFAHNKEVERFCQREGLIYCGEDWSARDITKKKKALSESEKKIKIEEIKPKKIGLEAWLQ